MEVFFERVVIVSEHYNKENGWLKEIEYLRDVKGFEKIVYPLGNKVGEDLSGKKFNRLNVISAVGRNKNKRILWLCECDCEVKGKVIALTTDLKRGATKSCKLSKECNPPKYENLEGRVFTRWTVVKDEGGKKVLCRCSCGTEDWVNRSNLKVNISTSCGCLRKELLHKNLTKDLTGKVFGRLLVVGLAGRSEKSKKLLWKVKCSCGTEKVVMGCALLSGKTRSCGCLQSEETVKRCTKSMITKVFGRLTVIEKVYSRKNRGAYYKCLCSCGNTTIVQGTMLRSGNTRSCDCLVEERHKEFDDLSGKRFGKLVVIERAWIDRKGHGTMYKCKCDCGGFTTTERSSLLSGDTMSCGCLNSKGEFKVANILKENGIIFEKQKTYKNLKTSNSKYSSPKFDFYIPVGNYLIEYDGEQHFKFSNSGWNNEAHFKKVQERDRVKNDYCRKNNIPLIRIPYTHLNNLCLEDLLLESTEFRVV